MPAPLEDLNLDHQCHFYQAPSGQRCGSPALKGEYYCYHHHLKHAKRNQRRVLIDPEITCMEIPPIEDRASIFIALAAVVHRLAENTIDTRRAGQMIYGLQVAMQALPPAPAVKSRSAHAPQSNSAIGTQPGAAQSTNSPQPVTSPSDEAFTDPDTVPISKEGLLYFLRSRHCASCNAELFPASELTERRNPGAPPEVIEEARRALPAPENKSTQTLHDLPAQLDRAIPSLHAVAENSAWTSHIPRVHPLPLSAALLDNSGSCAWPDSTTFRITTQDLAAGAKISPASRRATPHGRQAACRPKRSATLATRRTTQCARSSHCSVPSARTGTTPPPRTRRPPRGA